MSLLMDALKRAEEAKRVRPDGTAPAGSSPVGGELSLTPVDAPPPATPGPLPDLAAMQDSLDEQLQATAEEHSRPQAAKPARSAAPPPHPVVDVTAAQRATAQSVFTASGASTAPATPAAGASRTRVFIILGVGLLAMLGVGAYFYWQLQAISGGGTRVLSPVANAPRPMTPPHPVSQPVAAPGAPSAPTKDATPVTAPKPSVTPTPAEKAPTPTARARKITPPTGADSPASAAESAPAKPAASRAGARDAPPVSIERHTRESPIAAAHTAMQSGDLNAARHNYEQTLRVDRKNADAMVGLAAIAQREGDPARARRLLQQAVEVDPRHPAANAALVEMQSDADPIAAENRLKSLANSLNSDPAAAHPLHFALGNLQASQRRWGEAQQSYFRAHTGDPDHPDYLYNLAISLDQLGKGPLARQNYEKALQAAQKRPAAFDRARVEKRVAELGRDVTR